jgi:hypothetical protein
MLLTKNCLICGIQFSKPITCSKKVWLLGRKYCSVPCTNKSFVGKPNSSKTKFKNGNKPWSKGKECLQLKGENHGRWKGGKKRYKGYIFLYHPNHPHADSSGYVREHRLVMEKKLGRVLEPKEVVHHKNEIKDDNRLENLMLFQDNRSHLLHHHQKKVNS